MANDDELVALLRSIDRRLALLTVSQDRDQPQTLGSELLRTPQRIAMFEAINGERDSAELARVSNASTRSAQEFVKELSALGLVRSTPAK